ncbi:MAG: PH domain-containing protein [Chthoniobacter sp.]|nr:PH domain-containing protein [Chthoniobacter sp.]
MSEQSIWRGCSSQVKNFWPFVSCILVLPIPWVIYRWLVVKTTTYELTTERLITERGILNKTTDTLELYRVRDLQVTQPFWIRLFGLENIHLMTADTSSPCIIIDCVPKALGLASKFRVQVEATRMAKRVRTVDVEDDLHGDGGHAS